MFGEMYKIIESGIIMPFLPDGRGGVCDAKMNFIESSKYDGGWLKLGGSYEIGEDLDKIKSLDEKVIYLGFFYRHWGHFIMDCLGRAWVLCIDDADERTSVCSELQDYKIVYLTGNGKRVEGNYLRFFELLGVQKEQLIEVHTPTRFKEVLIPECAHWGDDNQLCLKPFQTVSDNWARFSSNREKYSGEKIYLSREMLPEARKKEIGEHEIRELFEFNGYRVLYPEELPLDEQIAIFRNADSIACVNGTIPLNVVFGNRRVVDNKEYMGNDQREKTQMIVLNKMSIPHMNLNLVVDAQGANVDYIDIYYEPIKGHPKYLGRGPFWMIPGKNFIEYFKNHNMNYDFSDKGIKGRIIYLRNYIKYFWLYIEIKVYTLVINSLRSIRNKLVAWLRHTG